jgi:predicted GNAT family acetyltransferase
MVESAHGQTQATEDNQGNLHVRWTMTNDLSRGRGEGTARMERVLQIARERGVKVFSDSAVSKLQQGVYKRLEEHGYKVKQHKDAVVNPDAGGLVTNDPRKPVFTIDQRERPARPTTGAGRGQKATPDAKTQSVVEFLANDPKGIDREDAEREGFDPADMKKATHGILKAFRRGGRSMDSVAELLSQHGFDVLDRDGNYSAEKAKELIDQDMRAMIAGTKAGRRYSHLNEDERQRELNRLEDERRERGLEILKADGETPEDARIIVETSEMTDEQARMFLGRHAATEETEDEREQRVEREAIRDEASDANHAEYAKPPEGETGEPADEGAGPNAEELRLEAESEYERREREDAQAAAEHAERAAIQSAEERRRADVEAKDFKLTGSESASDANPDQSDIFGMVAKDADEKGKPAPFVDGNGVERDAGVADEQLGSLEDQAKAEAEKAMNAANGCAQRGGT